MDKHEFSKAAEQHAVALLARATQLTRDEDIAKDLVQDTLIKGVRFCGQFTDGTSIRSWLFVIMRNTFINHFHKEKRKQALICTDTEFTSANLLKSSATNFSEGKFVMEDIRKALDSVPEVYRIPFQRYFEGYKYAEIAAELGIPLGTVKTHIHQARLMLKKYLSQYREQLL